jgi:tripartite-type tricarboxylate transporter receptor subunit TctC
MTGILTVIDSTNNRKRGLSLRRAHAQGIGGLAQVVALACACAPVIAWSQSAAVPGLPAKTIQIIVPNAPGGGPDVLARLIAPKLNESVKQNVVVENRPSVNGVVASEIVARSVADGSIIGMGNTGTHAINATLYRKLSYDPVRDFAAVSELVTACIVLVANPRLGVNTVKEMIEEARKAPGKLNIAIAGAHGEVAVAALKLQAGIDMKNIPYKGGPPATVAVLANEAQMVMTNYTAVAQHVEAGKLRLLGSTSAKRSSHLPHIPTIAESGGLDGYTAEMWYGMFLPAKTPPAVVQALSREVVRIVQLPDVKEKLNATGHEIVGTTPAEFSEKVRRETEMYRKIILESGMELL